MWRRPRRPQLSSLIWTKFSATGSWCRSLPERVERWPSSSARPSDDELEQLEDYLAGMRAQMVQQIERTPITATDGTRDAQAMDATEADQPTGEMLQAEP